jgi:hypothetical protein
MYLDPYLSLKALASYSDLSVRTLRTYLTYSLNPLPSYRVGGKILIRRSEFDSWIARYRNTGNVDVDQIVDDILKDLASQTSLKKPNPQIKKFSAATRKV